MTPNRQHAQVVIDAAAAGKHIYCEKPMAATVLEAESMATAVEQAGVVNQLTYNVRFIPAVMRAKQMLADGALGIFFLFTPGITAPVTLTRTNPSAGGCSASTTAAR